MVSRSLVLNKILQKHMGNRSKNTKKRYLEACGRRVCKKEKSRNGRERVNRIEGFGVVLYIYSSRSVWYKFFHIAE